MPLPIIVFGVAAKAAADVAVAAWTTGQVVAIGAATASTGGGLTAGVIYRNEINNFFARLLGWTSEDVKKVKEDFSDSVNNVTIKIQDLVSEVDSTTRQLQALEPKIESFCQSEPSIDALIDRSRNVNQNLEKTYGAKFLEFKQKKRLEREQNKFFGAPQQSRTDTNQEFSHQKFSSQT